MVHKLFSINGLVLLELFFAFLFHFFDDVFQLSEIHQSAFGFDFSKGAGVF